MRHASRMLAWLPGATLLAGCAGFGLTDGAQAPTFRQPGLSVPAASQAVVVGRSTKAEVAASLGQAEAVRFASGYEVWVYRAKGARDAHQASELAILFSPDGVVKKVRARPAQEPGR